ncbi:uncharacterized protein LOC111329382 isoform X1 [Stylophora pistillata]|uniref:Actin filament-associated protein 1 n=2 Tax=Stylophora pistillata TaxID=50429 RepID=A0A2B4SBZ7_STYPI|nr:uncharacterized protein LOC111329382 isoform X1 [Stylophora pistillata]PFX26118.1 Actin filament-associated protein 1 [Stylophora pistillata]
MDKHDRFIAINQTLPGLEEFLKEVLGSEPLSEEANKQRIEFLRRLESVSRPPSLPPRPANLGEIYRARLQNNEGPSGSGSQDESSVYKNEKAIDPVEFASQQRELSRATTIYKTLPPPNFWFGEKGSRNGGLYIQRSANTRDVRDSVVSTSSNEDDIYEHLSLKRLSPVEPSKGQEGETKSKVEDSFVFPSPPKTPQEHTSSIYVPARTGSLRGSGGKGKLSTVWFKKEIKPNEEVYVSTLREPVIQGYLKDVKANKRRWCVLQGNRLHIFKNQEDPAIMILCLPDCDIGVDDKKKISYSFRLTPSDGPGVTLAIEDGQDLSPWMSAIMAAAVRRSSLGRPISPLEGLFSLEEARERMRSAEIDGGIEEEEEEAWEDIYEKPVDFNVSGTPFDHSTPETAEFKEEEDEGYDAPLPPIPTGYDSSSESSSDEDESVESKGSSKKAEEKKKIYDAIPPDLLAELSAGQRKRSETNKSQDSMCEDGSTNDHSMDFTDSHSEHSGNISNRHSYIEPTACDDAVSSEPKEEKTESYSRKRTSTVLSASMESIGSDTEETRTVSVMSQTTETSKGLGPKVKRRRKLVPAEAEQKFLRDPDAMHSGILHQKRRLGVWSKRYCKIIDGRFKCYRNPEDQKPSLNFPILGYDISLIDNKETKKSYCIKISHPSQDTYFFATDSRVSIERWIEVLSLAATARPDVIAPYPPYFCAYQSGDELQSMSRESLLSSEGRLSDDDGADTLDELDPSSEKGSSLGRIKAKNKFPDEESGTTPPNDGRNVETVQNQPESQESEVKESVEPEVKERAQKKRKEKPKEGTKTPSTMSPPHSLFISESSDGQAKAEPMNEEYVSLAKESAKDGSEDSSSKKDRRWTGTLKKKSLSRGNSHDHRLRGNVSTSTHTENVKNKNLSMRRKNSQTFAHLMALFDKEGRFCGYLTEVRQNKFGTTHLRRWCVVKNGELIIFNSENEDTPQGKLSLVDMWLTNRSDERRKKFSFILEDKDGNETTLQTTDKDDFQKWMGVLGLFTELRVERPQPEVAEPPKKTDGMAGEEGEGFFERGTLRTKSARAATKLKDEIYSLAPGKVRSSLRMKLSQKVNVRDIFRKTHSSYDLEGMSNEGSSLPEPDIDTLAVFGGLLTQVEPDGSTNSRWCTIKEKELLIFTDRKAPDSLCQIPLWMATFSDLSDTENSPNRFQVRYGREKVVFDTCDKFDHNRWLKMLASATERRNSSDEDKPKCVGLLTSPTFAKKKLLHRRTRSEALSQGDEISPATPLKEGSVSSTSSTDRLMSGYLQEIRDTKGARTRIRRWCIATSEKFLVYDNQNSSKASFEWELSEMTVQDRSDMDTGVFEFSVSLGEKRLSFKVIDEDSARHWLSVLARYCQPIATNQPLFKTPSKVKRKEERRRSASWNDLKSKQAEKEKNDLEVLSEGRASGRKLTRRATEDYSFLRMFNRSESFRAPWRTSQEKLEVKMRERSGRTATNRAWKRFSCGTLFDSDGKYSGHLMEIIMNKLYRSQVRRWCVQKDNHLYVYENEAALDPVKVVPLFKAKVVDTSDIEACVYKFRIDYGEANCVFFQALTRTDLEKWTTVISVKIAVLQDRSERQLRRNNTLSSGRTMDTAGSSECEFPSPLPRPSSMSLTGDSLSLNETLSICSADSVFASANDAVTSADGETVTSFSSGLKPIGTDDETAASSMTDEQSPSDQGVTDAGLPPAEGTASEIETLEGNRKTVDKMSLIEDWSHIYENFLAFASAMAERNPEELYHVYENVTQALHPGSQVSAQSDGLGDNSTGLGDNSTDRGNNSTGNESNEKNKVESPAMEMSSEFEKITLQENEDGVSLNRSSGTCDETAQEKLTKDANQEGQDLNRTVENDETSKIDGETLVAAVSSGGDEDVARSSRPVIGESQDLTLPSRNEEIEEFGEHVKDINWVKTKDFEEASDNEVPSESLGNVVTSRSTFGAEAADETFIQERNAVDTQPSLVHNDNLSDTERGENSFYVVKEGNDQLWREIEDEEIREPVIASSVEANAVQVSFESKEEQLEEGTFDLDVEKSALSTGDEDKATEVKVQDLQDVHNDDSNTNICTEAEVSLENDLGLTRGQTQTSHEETPLGEHDKMFLEREGHALPGSPSMDLKGGEATGSQFTSAVAQHSDIFHDTRKEEIALNSSSQPDVRDPDQESEVIHTFGAVDTHEEHANEVLEVSCEDAEKLQSLNTVLSSNDLPASGHMEDNLWLQQDTEQSQETLDEGVELERYSSDEGFYTPEDTIDLSLRSNSVAGEDRETNLHNNRTQNSDPEPSCTESEKGVATLSKEGLHSEGDSKTLTTQGVDGPLSEKEAHVSLPEVKELQEDSVSRSSLEDKQQLTSMDILKAVTAAFEEILELHGDERDADDTRL